MARLTLGEITIRVILLVHAFWRTLSTMTVLVPIIVFLAWVLLWWAWKTTTSQEVNNLFSRSSKAFFLIWYRKRSLLTCRFPSHALAFEIHLTILTHRYTNTEQHHTSYFTKIVTTIQALSNNTNLKKKKILTSYKEVQTSIKLIFFLILEQFGIN